MAATIQIEGTTIGTVADLDGNFTISNLSPGKYRLIIKYIAYSDAKVETSVIASKNTSVNIEMVDESLALAGVVVIATHKFNNEISLLTSV